MCQGLEPIYVRDEHGFFVEVMNTNSDYKVFFHESRNGRSEINIISPEDKKLLVLLEPSMLVSTRN